ncbi:MAG: PKD domain-containing protein, partial [Bacteroidota bacterium]
MASLARRYIASVDRETGLGTKWETSANSTVFTIQVAGNQIYVGGQCSQIGYRERNYAAAFNLNTGLMASWNPGFNSNVYTMINSGDSIYVGGSYNNVAGVSRNYIGKYDANFGYMSPWNPNANNQILGMALMGDKIYLGGSFGSIGGKARNRLASVDTLTAAVTNWNPNVNSNVWGILPIGDKVYVVGDFTQIGTKNRRYIAELDTISANSSVTNTTGWDASANSNIFTIKGDAQSICVGGSYSDIGSPFRDRLAAININTGELLGFDPVVNSSVRSLVVEDGKLYVGGSFNNISGASRTYLARFDLNSGRLDAWAPALNNVVNTIKKKGSTIYLGGSFTTINSTTRNRIASMDTSGTLTSWDPNASNTVSSIEITANTLYVGGDFINIGGQARNRIASFDNSGVITSWNPNANNGVTSLLARFGRLYVGGSFTNIGGVSRNYISSFDLASGMPNVWNPNADNAVLSLAGDRNLIYLGGYFGAVGGKGRSFFASVDTSGTGFVTSWAPNPNCYVYTIVPKGDTIISGGCYGWISNTNTSHLSGVSRYALNITGANKSGVCAGESVRVYYTITPDLPSGNVFTLQLSDSSGSFNNPLNIGTLTSSVSDTINGVIPTSITKFSVLYKLRIISSSGTVVGPAVWASNFTINPIAVAGFTVNRSNQCLGNNSFVFNNTSVPITNNFTWSFGDNTTSNQINPVKSYSNAGTFQVQLISGGTFCRDTARMTVTVDSTIANFIPNRYAQCEDSAQFNFTNTTTPSLAGKSFKWNYGTGISDTANSVNGQKTYSSVGEYSVKLIVTSASGCKDSITRKVNLYPFPAAPVVADVTRCGPGTVTFNTSVPTGFVNKWYSTPFGGTPIASGNTFTTPSLSTTTSYYVETQYNLTPVIGDTISSARMLIGLRKLKSSYNGNAIKIRRSSDNVTQFFGFVNGELDTVAIRTWLGSATPFVEIVYDQSGFGNNMVQTNNGNQPVLIFSGHNGKPALRFNTSQFMRNASNFQPPYSVIGIAKLNGGSNNRVFSAANNWLLGYWGGAR